jgi:outer membrane autotransporter protein
VAAINALTTPAAVVSAVAQLAPSVPDLAAPQVTFQGTRQFEDFWLSHLDEVMCGQVSQPQQVNQPDAGNATCRTNEPQAGGWLKGFGYFGSQGSQAAFGGYNFNIYGTMVGYDAPLIHMPIEGETRVGFGIGYARSTINGTTFSANTDFNTYTATAYIAHEQGPWFVDGDLSFGWDDYSGTRNISFPGVNQAAQASYSGQDYTAFVTTGYHFFAQGITITPLASLQYTHMDIGGYGETGAGAIDLNVQSQHYDFLESGLGVKVADPFRYRDGTYVPEVHFKWFHEFVNPSVQDTAAFAVPGSPSFTTPGLKPAADTFNVGAGLTFLSCSCTARTWSVEGTYDFFWRSDAYTANQVMLRFTARF